MKTFELTTTYRRYIKAENEEEAASIAMKELENMNGLGGEWIWSENIDNSILISKDYD